MPVYLKVTALWGGQPGSLLFWAWTLSTFVAAVMLRRWDRDREFLPWVILVSLLIMIFFLILVIFVENPFTRIWQVAGVGEVVTMFPPDGGCSPDPTGRQWSEPSSASSGYDHSPSHPLSGFCSFCDTLCLCHGCFDSPGVRMTAGSGLPGVGRWLPGFSFLWGWFWAAAGLMMFWDGAVTGAGIRLRLPH